MAMDICDGHLLIHGGYKTYPLGDIYSIILPLDKNSKRFKRLLLIEEKYVDVFMVVQ